ncbi:MAG: hypothetical protein JWM15_655, partial [Cryptosporangiaceae bacterium]|nr:hypothetical protein [Cryptosporangiaceae bacterium]
MFAGVAFLGVLSDTPPGVPLGAVARPPSTPRRPGE